MRFFKVLEGRARKRNILFTFKSEEQENFVQYFAGKQAYLIVQEIQ